MADKIQIEIATSADTSGAEKAEQAIAQIGKAADKDVDSLKALQEEMAARFSAQKDRIDNIGGGATPPPLPGEGMDIPGVIPAAAAASLVKTSLQAVKAVYDEVAQAMAKGTQQAIEFSEQLRTLPSDKADELRERLGPVADLLDANSSAIAEYAKHAKDAEHASENFWIALQARAIPALNELRESAGAGKDISDLGIRLGTDLAGGAHIAAESLRLVDAKLGDTKITVGNLSEALLRLAFPTIAGADGWLNKVGEAALANEKKVRDAADAADGGARIAANADKVAADVAQARADAEQALLPAAERIAALREKQAGLMGQASRGDEKAGAEAAAIEKQIVGLENKQKLEADADANKEKTVAATKAEAEERIRLNEAIASGKKEQEDLIRAKLAGEQVLKSTGDRELAARAYNAEAKILADRRAKGEQQQADRKKAEDERAAAETQREDDRKKREEESIAKKREELELETRINEAKATGNKEEVAKLEWLKTYNRLLSQKDASGNQIFSDEDARRAANAQSASSPLAPEASHYVKPEASHYVKPGDLAPGTNKRRGLLESDEMWDNSLNLQPGESLLDQYKANQSRAVGSIGGKSILGADPKSSDDSKGNAINTDQVAKAADDMKGAASGLGDIGKQISSALDKVASASGSTKQEIETLKSGLSDALSKIEALASKT